MSDSIEYRHRDLDGEKLHIGKDDRLWDCRLQGCQLTFAKPNGQWVSDNIFTDCNIHVEGRYTKVWPACQFIRCRFTGTYYNTDIGVMKDGQSDLTDRLVDCDFSNAKMHFVRLINCNFATIMFPMWPHITLIDKARAILYLSGSADPYALILSECFSAPSSGEAAVVWNLKDYSKQAQKYVSTDDRFRDFDEAKGAYVMRPGSEIDLDRTRAVFENCPGVII